MFSYRHFTGIVLALLLTTRAAAQTPVQRKEPVIQARPDSIRLQTTEQRNAATVKQYKLEISQLENTIMDLNKEIKDLQAAADQAQKDYFATEAEYNKAPGRKNSILADARKNALKKKLKDYNDRINHCYAQIKISKELIKVLQGEIAKLSGN